MNWNILNLLGPNTTPYFLHTVVTASVSVGWTVGDLSLLWHKVYSTTTSFKIYSVFWHKLNHYNQTLDLHITAQLLWIKQSTTSKKKTFVTCLITVLSVTDWFTAPLRMVSRWVWKWFEALGLHRQQDSDVWCSAEMTAVTQEEDGSWIILIYLFYNVNVNIIMSVFYITMNHVHVRDFIHWSVTT